MKPEQAGHGSSSQRPIDEAEAPVENTTHSFVLRLWQAEEAAGAGRAIWRGHITHVSDGQRRYLRSPQEILAFVMSFLQPAGFKRNFVWRVRDWLCAHAGPR